MRSLIAVCAPLPRASMAMTAATPMMIPSMVSIERSLCARGDAKATRTISVSSIDGLSRNADHTGSDCEHSKGRPGNLSGRWRGQPCLLDCASGPGHAGIDSYTTVGRDGPGCWRHVKVLVVEDDDKLAGVVLRGLNEQQVESYRARDFAEGRERLLFGAYDAIVLAVMLPT